jgi:two-component system, OmpR family, KDP operon response regulator KdpE
MPSKMNFDAIRKANDRGPLILVVQDVEETRDGVEALLKAGGYRVDAVRDEEDAVIQARRKHPDLILVNLGMAVVELIVAARRIRERAKLSEEVPVVIFCVDGVGEGDEVEIGQNVYVTRPDNFNQLRGLLGRLVEWLPLVA